MKNKTRLLVAGLFYAISGMICIYLLTPAVFVLKTDDYILLKNNVASAIGFICSVLTLTRGLDYIAKSIKN